MCVWKKSLLMDKNDTLVQQHKGVDLKQNEKCEAKITKQKQYFKKIYHFKYETKIFCNDEQTNKKKIVHLWPNLR